MIWYIVQYLGNSRELSIIKNIILNDKVAISNETRLYFIKKRIIFATDFKKQTK